MFTEVCETTQTSRCMDHVRWKNHKRHTTHSTSLRNNTLPSNPLYPFPIQNKQMSNTTLILKQNRRRQTPITTIPTLQIGTTHNNTLVQLHQHKHTPKYHWFVDGSRGGGASAGWTEGATSRPAGPDKRANQRKVSSLLKLIWAALQVAMQNQSLELALFVMVAMCFDNSKSLLRVTHWRVRVIALPHNTLVGSYECWIRIGTPWLPPILVLSVSGWNV